METRTVRPTCPWDPGGWGLIIPEDHFSETWLLDPRGNISEFGGRLEAAVATKTIGIQTGFERDRERNFESKAEGISSLIFKGKN